MNFNFRDNLANYIVGLSTVALVIVGAIIIFKDGEDLSGSKLVYNSLLPLVGTWVGTILAFYFGSANYEAAASKYEKIIDKLTPELLDDVLVNQIMITKKTMVSKVWSKIENLTVSQVIQFLKEVDKSRLPVLDKKGDIKYIIHESSLLGVGIESSGPEALGELGSKTMSEFVKSQVGIVDQIVKINDDSKLEDARKELENNPKVKDIFVINSKGELTGWLTDTLILRYISIS